MDVAIGKLVAEQTGRLTPAFGMIGTLAGPILMLGDMSNPAAIGPGMAVAVIATRYRVPAANRFLLRFAEKLSYISRHDLPAKELVVRGVFAPKVRTERRKAS